MIAEKHGGPTALENLACYGNRFKGTDLASIDPVSGRTVRLFQPRSQRRHRHFGFKGAGIADESAKCMTARSTVSSLPSYADAPRILEEDRAPRGA